MLIVRFLLASHPTPLYGRVRRETPQILEVLSGDPLRGPVEPTGQTLPYEPDAWQAAGERSPVLLLPPVVPSKIVAIGYIANAAAPVSASAVLTLTAGDVIRPHTDGNATGTATACDQFIIERVG